MVVHSYYESEWAREYETDIDVLKGLSLKDVYGNLIRQLIPIENVVQDDIEKLMKPNEKRERLEREIGKLEKKVRRERQFNRKVDLNIQLQKKKKKFEELLNKK